MEKVDRLGRGGTEMDKLNQAIKARIAGAM
jgi:hypothetical protein